MNQNIHDKLQVSIVTNKQASAEKLLNKPKKVVGMMFHTKFYKKFIKFEAHSFTG